MAKKKSDEKSNPDQTPKKKRTGRGAMNGNETGVSFTKENQPSSEAKKAGWARKNGLKEMMSIVPNPKADRKLSAMMNKVAKFFEIPVTEVTIRLMMDYRMQLEAAHNGNVHAYKVVTERIEGKPRMQGWDAPPPITPDEEVIRRKSTIDFGDGITFEI